MNLTELIRAIIDRCLCTCQASEENKRLLTEAIVKAIPKREHGEWEKEVFDLVNHLPLRVAYQCSCCHEFFDSEYNFCPHCGADMRGNNK